MRNERRNCGLSFRMLRVLVVLLCLCWSFSSLPVGAESPDRLQKPVIPHKHITELQAKLTLLGFDTKPFDQVAQAVVDLNNPDLAFRLLLDGPEIRLWDSAWHGRRSAAEEGQLVRLQLLHLAERPGWGVFTTYPTRDVSPAISNRHPKVVEFILKHWEVEPEHEKWLVEAAQRNLPQTVELLLELYGDQAWLREQIPAALVEAAAVNNRPSLIRLLDTQADPNQIPRGYWLNPLQAALWHGHPDLAQTLVTRGANLDICTAAGLGQLDELKRLSGAPLPENLTKTRAPQALFWAARNGQTDCLKFLLERGEDVNSASREGWTPLHAAIHSNSSKTVQLLLDYGANPLALGETYYDRSEFLSPLHMAAAEGKLELVQLFIEQGVSPWTRGKQQEYNQQGIPLSVEQSPFGSSALTLTLQRKQQKVVQFLLPLALADLQAVPRKLSEAESDTALAIAASAGQLEMCRELIKAGARVEGEDGITGYSPLQGAASAGQAEVVKLLLASGAKANGATTESSQTPLHLAAQGGHAEVVLLLLDSGAAIDARQPAQPPKQLDDDQLSFRRPKWLPAKAAGVRPLTLAAQQGHSAVVKLLLERGAEPDLERTEPIPSFLKDAVRQGIDQRASSPLEAALGLEHFSASDFCHLEAATLLIEAGARMDLTHVKQNLELTVEQGDVARLELLERAGARIEDLDGELLYKAVAGGNRDMVRALIARGIDPQTSSKIRRPDHVLKFDKMKPILIATIIEACPDQLLPIRFEIDAPQKDANGTVDHSELFRFYGGTPLPTSNRWLLDAISHADVEKVKSLLEKGYDVNAPFGSLYPITRAFEVKDLKVIEFLFAHGARLDRLPDGGSTLLGRLADRHYDASVNSEYGDSPYSIPTIVHAPYGEDDDPDRDTVLLKLLIERGADPNQENKLGNTPLHTLLIHRKVALARTLVELGAKQDVFAAAALGATDELGRLLDANPNLVEKTHFYDERDQPRTPLDWALAAGNRRAAELLVTRQAPLVKGELQLEEIVASRNHDLLDWFLQQTSEEPPTPATLVKALDAAIRPLPQPEMVRVLLKHGANPTTDPNLLVLAAQHGDVAIIDQLVAAGASVNVKVRAYPYQQRHDHDEMSPLLVAVATSDVGYAGSPKSKHYAEAKTRRLTAALRLLELGADPRQSSPGVLNAAVSEGDIELIGKLLEAGANPNDQTSIHQFTNATPLHLAVSKREYPAYKKAEALAHALAIIDLLLAYGANPKLISDNDFGGRSPLGLAQEYEDGEAIQRLQAAMKNGKSPPPRTREAQPK